MLGGVVHEIEELDLRSDTRRKAKKPEQVCKSRINQI